MGGRIKGKREGVTETPIKMRLDWNAATGMGKKGVVFEINPKMILWLATCEEEKRENMPELMQKFKYWENVGALIHQQS